MFLDSGRFKPSLAIKKKQSKKKPERNIYGEIAVNYSLHLCAVSSVLSNSLQPHGL